MKKAIVLIACCFLVLAVSAQLDPNYGIVNTIPFYHNNDTLMVPASGGLDAPEFAEIDLDGDGILDLLIYERNGKVLKPFINGGTPNKVDYQYAPEYIKYFPPLLEIAVLRDFNRDGKMDIFTQAKGVSSLVVWKNTTSSGPLSFEKIDYFFDSQANAAVSYITSDYYGDYTSNVYLWPGDIPGIEDIDGDGDLDILNVGSWGNLVEFHKNLSVELTGGYDTLAFELATGCWGHFYENSTNNSVTFGYNCKGRSADPFPGGGRHVGSNLLPLNLDGDQDFDLLISDIGFPNMIALNNTGSASNAVMTSMDSTFPSNDVPIDLFLFPGMYYLDLDNDNVKELVTAPHKSNDGINYDNVWFYENNGANDNPDFQLMNKNFMTDQMVDVGSGAHPVLFDASGDGLPDLIVGNFGYGGPSGIYEGALAYYENTGSANKPEFSLITEDYMGIRNQGMIGLYPAFGDLDNDGDEDMVLGKQNGELLFYLNTAGAGNPANFQPDSIAGLDGIDVGEFAAPQLVDLNGDNLLDLVIGEKNGTLNFLPNSGTQTSATFNPSDLVTEFGGVVHQNRFKTGYTTPFFAMLDTAGTLSASSTASWYAFVGIEEGFLHIYELPSSLNSNFTFLDSIYTGGHKASVGGGDLNGDGVLDLICGQAAGGIQVMMKGTGITIPPPEKPEDANPPTGVQENLKAGSFHLFPNPANDRVLLSFGTPARSNSLVRVFNVRGKEMLRTMIPAEQTKLNLNLSGLNSGLYIIVIKQGQTQATKKLVVE